MYSVSNYNTVRLNPLSEQAGRSWVSYLEGPALPGVDSTPRYVKILVLSFVRVVSSTGRFINDLTRVKARSNGTVIIFFFVYTSHILCGVFTVYILH